MPTKEQFEREKRYQLARILVKSMLDQGVINPEQHLTVMTRMKAFYRPIFGGLAA